MQVSHFRLPSRHWLILCVAVGSCGDLFGDFQFGTWGYDPTTQATICFRSPSCNCDSAHAYPNTLAATESMLQWCEDAHLSNLCTPLEPWEIPALLNHQVKAITGIPYSLRFYTEASRRIDQVDTQRA